MRDHNAGHAVHLEQQAILQWGFDEESLVESEVIHGLQRIAPNNKAAEDRLWNANGVSDMSCGVQTVTKGPGSLEG